MLKRILRIFYGSQTGTAKEVANRIRRMVIRLRFDAVYVIPLDSVKSIEELMSEEGSACVFVVSTTGQGNEPDNMKVNIAFFSRN